jgi:hypothetical protein
MTKYWLGVVSREHVLRGVEGSYVQVCHGKKDPLAKMKPGDGFVYYSPTHTFKGSDKLQAFTAIGTVKTGDVYQVEMFPGFKPYRCDVKFEKSTKEVKASDLKSKLGIMQGNWGFLLRRGHVEIPEEDFNKIAAAMGTKFENKAAINAGDEKVSASSKKAKDKQQLPKPFYEKNEQKKTKESGEDQEQGPAKRLRKRVVMA